MTNIVHYEFYQITTDKEIFAMTNHKQLWLKYFSAKIYQPTFDTVTEFHTGTREDDKVSTEQHLRIFCLFKNYCHLSHIYLLMCCFDLST